MSGRIDKTELIKKLRDLEGLTDEEKSNLIGLLRQHKKYGLVWEDKPEDVEERLREELPVLTEVKERRIISDAPDAPNHILIEGDNLEALTALSYTHEGKIDVIYIDPPYNTGNKDFAYYDDFSDEYRTIPYVEREDAFRHSKWLSFISKRLRIAKRLLSDKGVIFISIDDNEQANLKLLCDEVFGERNFLAQIVWQKIHSIKNDARYFSQSHEYAFVFAKNIELVKIQLLPRTETMNSRYVNKDNDPRGPWQSGDLVANGERTNGHYIVTSPKSGKQFDVPKGKHWVYSEANMNELIESNSIWFGEDGNAFPRKKRFLCDVQEGRTPNTLWLSEEVGNNQSATREVIDIFNERGRFDFPKPLAYIKQMLQLSSLKSSFVLDFFAGSGTTLHATMQLNAEDGGHRQCILVTNNENGICEQVTYERNKRVIQGYTTPKGQAVEGLHNNNLRYYCTEFIPRERTQRNMRALVNAATDLLCIKENLYEEKPSLGTLKLKPQLARYFSDGQKHMLVVYREEVANELVEAIKTLELGKSMLKIYIFSPGRYAFDDDFYEVQDKVQLVALPAAIYDAYQRVLPKQKERLLDEAEVPAPQPTASAMTIDFEEGGEQ